MAVATGAGWYELGACRDHPVAVFFPEKNGDARPAKRICAGCQVKEQCLAEALANPDTHGIWGGQSRDDRRRIMRGERAAPVPTPVEPGHGSEAGYKAHWRRAEKPCVDCAKAHRAYNNRTAEARRAERVAS